MASNPHLQMPILTGGESVLGVNYEAFEFDICIDRTVTNARLLVDFKTNMFGFMGVESYPGLGTTISGIAAPKGRFAFRKLNKDGSIAFQVIMEGYIGYMCKIHEPLLPDLTDSDLAQIFSNRNACMFSSNLAGGTPIYGVSSSSDLPSISMYMSGNTYSAGVSFSSLSGNTPKRIKFGIRHNATKNAVAMRGETSSTVTGTVPLLHFPASSMKAHNLGSVLAIKGSGSIPRSTKPTAPSGRAYTTPSSVFDGPPALSPDRKTATGVSYAQVCPGNGVGRAIGIDPTASGIDISTYTPPMISGGGSSTSVNAVEITKGLIGSIAGTTVNASAGTSLASFTINYPEVNLYERIGVYQTPYASKITRLTKQGEGGDHVVEWCDADKKFV